MIALVTLALSLQTAPAKAPPPQRWSVLADLSGACVPSPTPDDDVVVCVAPHSPRLPLQDAQERGRRAAHERFDVSNVATPCAASQKGCPVVFGPNLNQLLGAANAIGDAFRKGGRASGVETGGPRVPISLED